MLLKHVGLAGIVVAVYILILVFCITFWRVWLYLTRIDIAVLTLLVNFGIVFFLTVTFYAFFG